MRAVKTPENVLTLSDFAESRKLGVRIGFGTEAVLRTDVLGA
ncbi:hypothetical protein [Actinacidiphila acididurans]|nr:hypothetical protein [Actinacidiphila acididurans]